MKSLCLVLVENSKKHKRQNRFTIYSTNTQFNMNIIDKKRFLKVFFYDRFRLTWFLHDWISKFIYFWIRDEALNIPRDLLHVQHVVDYCFQQETSSSYIDAYSKLKTDSSVELGDLDDSLWKLSSSSTRSRLMMKVVGLEDDLWSILADDSIKQHCPHAPRTNSHSPPPPHLKSSRDWFNHSAGQ